MAPGTPRTYGPPSVPLDGFAICNSRGRRVSLLNEVDVDETFNEYPQQPSPHEYIVSSALTSECESFDSVSCCSSPPATISSSLAALSPRLPPVSDLISFSIPDYDRQAPVSNGSSPSASLCLRRQSMPSTLNRKGRSHSIQTKGSKRRYECSTCGKTFTTSGHVARHNRIHTGEKNFQCPEPGCMQRFSRQDNCM